MAHESLRKAGNFVRGVGEAAAWTAKAAVKHPYEIDQELRRKAKKAEGEAIEPSERKQLRKLLEELKKKTSVKLDALQNEVQVTETLLAEETEREALARKKWLRARSNWKTNVELTAAMDPETRDVDEAIIGHAQREHDERYSLHKLHEQSKEDAEKRLRVLQTKLTSARAKLQHPEVLSLIERVQELDKEMQARRGNAFKLHIERSRRALQDERWRSDIWNRLTLRDPEKGRRALEERGFLAFREKLAGHERAENATAMAERIGRAFDRKERVTARHVAKLSYAELEAFMEEFHLPAEIRAPLMTMIEAHRDEKQEYLSTEDAEELRRITGLASATETLTGANDNDDNAEVESVASAAK